MRREAALLLAGGLLLAAVPAHADDGAPVKTRTSCDMYGRCFEFAGPNDLLAAAGANLWERVDPLALASGTPGDPVELLPDD